MKRVVFAVVLVVVPTLAHGATLLSQLPVSGGGVTRWSQLWQDPSPAGNNLDGDSVCWADFTLAAPATINHLEWWGQGASELGFQIEFWRQDPGTIAYQPLGVFYYGVQGEPAVHPEPPGFLRTNSMSAEPWAGGLTHFSLDLATPVNLAANSSANPRWFVGIVGLTQQAYATWNWAQGSGAGHTFQFIRGEGPMFRSLGDGRALLIGDNSIPEPTPGDTNGDGIVDLDDLNNVRNHFGESGAGVVGDTSPFNGTVDLDDLNNVRNNFGTVTPAGVPEPSSGVVLLVGAVAVLMTFQLASPSDP